MRVMGRAGGCFVAALVVTAGCGTGVAPQGETSVAESGTQSQRSASRGVVLSVRKEDAGVCGQDREFRFGVENHTRSRLTGGLLRFDLDDPRDPFPAQKLICGATDGPCNVSRVPRNFS